MKECELIKGGHTFGLLAVRHEKKNCIVNHTMHLSKMSAIVQANMRSPSGNCNATKTIQKNKIIVVRYSKITINYN